MKNKKFVTDIKFDLKEVKFLVESYFSLSTLHSQLSTPLLYDPDGIKERKINKACRF
jgi:hypothetical protein